MQCVTIARPVKAVGGRKGGYTNFGSRRASLDRLVVAIMNKASLAASPHRAPGSIRSPPSTSRLAGLVPPHLHTRHEKICQFSRYRLYLARPLKPHVS